MPTCMTLNRVKEKIKDNLMVVVIVGSFVPLLVIALSVATYFWCKKRRKKKLEGEGKTDSIEVPLKDSTEVPSYVLKALPPPCDRSNYVGA